jgi:hypothetical protein
MPPLNWNPKRGFFMTVDEQRQQKAEVLLDYYEAEQNLKQLLAKIATMAERLEEVVLVMKRASSDQPGVFDMLIESPELNAPSYREAMNLLTALTLIGAITTARRRLKTLADRKALLGL